MGETTIRIAVAPVWGAAVLGARGAEPAAIGTLYVAAVTAALVQSDLRERRLPNALVLPGWVFTAVGVLWSALGDGDGGAGAVVLLASVSCGVGVLVVFAALASGGGLGMGDVKLAAVLGAALAATVAERGPPLGEVVVAIGAWVSVSLVAGAAAASWVVRHDRALQSELPFGPVLLAAFWAFVL